MARTFVPASSQYLETTAGGVTAALPITIAVWFKTAQASANITLASLYNNANKQYNVALELLSGAVLASSYYAGGYTAATSAGSYSTGAWQHACGVFASATSRTAYVNGGGSGSDTTNRAVTGLDTFQLGAYMFSSRQMYFDGDLAECGIWDVALTADEIASLGKGFAPALIRPASLLAYYPVFGNASPEPDRWKNRYDLTVTGATKADHPRIYYPSRAKVSVAVIGAASFAADLAASVALAAALSVGATFSAAATATASTSATLTTGESLRAAVTGTATTSATLSAGAILRADAIATATTSATFAEIRPLGRPLVTIGGTAWRSRVGSLTVRDLLNDAPNTCSFTVDTVAPAAGQEVLLTIGNGTVFPELLFAGSIVNVDALYELQTTNRAWQVSCQDFTRTINRRKVRTRYAQQSATDIALDLAANYTTGFTTGGIAADLPTVTGGIDFTEEDLLTCYRRLASRIGGYADVDYEKVIRLFLTEASDAPDPLVPGSMTLLLEDPPVTWSTDHSQLRTRDLVEGGGSVTPILITAGMTTIPLLDGLWYSASGGFVVAGPQRIAYTGRTLATGAGALVGSSAKPTNAPTLTKKIGTGLSAGVYLYALTYYDGTGQTEPGPTASITLGDVIAAPASAPTVAKILGAGNLNANGVYGWKYTYVTAGGEETTPSSASSSLTMNGDISAPTSIGTANSHDGSANGCSNSLTPGGLYSYKFTFTDGTVETLPSPASNAFFPESGGPTEHAGYVTESGTSSPPGGWSRRFYRTTSGGSTWKRMTGSVFGGFEAELVSTYWIEGRADGTLGADAPSASTAVYRRATVAVLASADSNVTGIQVYRTTDGGSTYKKSGSPLSNANQTYIDNVADGSLGANAPSANTAVYGQVSLSTIPIGPTGTTGRKIQRTAVDGSQLKLQSTIANNTATTATDSTADGSLGADAPTTNTSALVNEVGSVAAGSASVPVTGLAPFQSGGGWAFAGGQYIRYTGYSSTALTGVPASGPGSLASTVNYGTEILATAFLSGIAASGEGSIQNDIDVHGEINILEICDDLDAQAELATLEGGDSDGVYEHYIQDRRLASPEARATGFADLALFSRPIVTVHYGSHDPKTRSGKTVHADLPDLGLLGDFTITSVTIDQIGTANPEIWPRYTVEASSVRFSFEDVLRRLQLEA